MPGVGAGHLTPDGNIAIYIDKAILGRFQDGTPYSWILTSLGFGVTVLMGVLSGHLLRSKLPGARKAQYLAAAGVLCLVLAQLISPILPIIKHIWTSSMILWAGGLSLLLLALFYWLIDVRGYHRWAFPFTVIGMNAIVAYMAGELLPWEDLSRIFLGGLASHMGQAGHALIAFGAFAALWLILYHLYRNRTFLRI